MIPPFTLYFFTHTYLTVNLSSTATFSFNYLLIHEAKLQPSFYFLSLSLFGFPYDALYTYAIRRKLAIGIRRACVLGSSVSTFTIRRRETTLRAHQLDAFHVFLSQPMYRAA